MTIKERIKNILRDAVTAPSGDNSQPWWFHLEDQVLDVHMIPDKDNPILNFRLGGSYVALGTLVENIIILSSTAGLRTSLELLPDPSKPYLISRITFSDDASIVPDPLAPFVTKRCTNRKPYHNKVLPADVVRDITNTQNELGGRVRVITTTDKHVITSTANASSMMERVALETEAIHKLFFGNIVWSKEEEHLRGMGLPIKTTELPPPIQFLFRLIKDWKKTKLLNRIGLSRMASKANAATYGKAPLVGVVAVSLCDAKAYIDAGRIFQRIWIKAAKYGLAFQPVTGILFLAQRVLANETKELHNEHLPLIKDAYSTIKEKFGLTQDIPVLYFRIGYADAPSAYTSRRAPEFR